MRRMRYVLGATLFLTTFVHDAFAQRQPAIIVSKEVQEVFGALWLKDSLSKREHIACIGGEVKDTLVNITRAQFMSDFVPENDSFSDSLGVNDSLSLLSLRVCNPPKWFGTVHTHGAANADFRATWFSPADRAVISFWHVMYRKESIFCILYSGDTGKCEYRRGAGGD